MSVEKPTFDLKADNTIAVSLPRVSLGLWLRSTLTVTDEVKVLFFIPAGHETNTLTLFDGYYRPSLTVQDIEAQLVAPPSLQGGIAAKVTKLSVSFDLGFKLLDDVADWLADAISKQVIEALPTFRLLPPILRQQIDLRELSKDVHKGPLSVEIDDDVVPPFLTVEVSNEVVAIDADEFTAAANVTVAEMGRTVSPVPRFIANRNPERMIVHRAHCPWIEEAAEVHRLGYYVLIDALHDGFNGCKDCLPEYHRPVHVAR